jgi:hypothetical protein
MELIRENKEKQRATFFCGDRYRKEWYSTSPVWISYHVQLLNIYIPNYVLNFGDTWIEYKIISGTPISTLPHTIELASKVYNFCLDNIQSTTPYVHGDWSLSNMLLDGETIQMCDWDNLGIYPKEQVEGKLLKDLIDAFGITMMQRVLPSLDPNVVRQYQGL